MTRISVGEYVATRLVQLGASRVFGAADARKSVLIDEMCRNGELAWTESASELSAAYAADGFARTATRPAVVITNSDIGGLSAIVGLADAGTVGAPVVLVAALATGVDSPLHDALLDRMSIGRAVLSPVTAAAEIDRVLAATMTSSAPAYLGIPLDVAHAEVDASPLGTPLHWLAGATRTPAVRRPVPVSARRDVDGREAVDLEVLWAEIAESMRTGATVVADHEAAGDGIPGLSGGSEIVAVSPGASAASIIPVALGAALARPDRRLVLAVGAETVRPAVDDLGRLLSTTAAPVVFVLDDADSPADAPHWTWELVPAVLGDRRARVFSVTTVAELREALDAAAEATRPVFVRVSLVHRGTGVSAAA